MHIVYIVNELAYFRAHRERLATDMADLGHRVTVVAGLVSPTVLKGWDDRLALVPVEIDLHHFRPVQDARLVLTIAALLRAQRPDIVHAITIKPVLYGGLAQALFMGRPLRKGIGSVWTFPGLGRVFEPGTGWYHHFRRSLVANGLRLAVRRNRTVATFENSADLDAMTAMAVVPRHRSRLVLGTGIDLDTYAPAKRLRGAPLTIVMAARLTLGKGVTTFIEAARALRKKHPDVRFLLAGLPVPDNPDAIDQTIVEKAVKDGTILYREGVSQKEMPDLLGSAHAVALPTRLREGFPRMLLEAAACGCALIASDQTSIRVLVREGVTGWLLPTPDARTLATAMEDALSDRSRLLKFGRQARKLVTSLPVDAVATRDDFLRVYRLAMKRPSEEEAEAKAAAANG